MFGGDHRHVELVNLLELRRFGVCRAGHPRQLSVHAEVVLNRNRRQRLVLPFDADPLLRLDRLMESVGPSTARHQPSGELVDDNDLSVLDDVIDIPLEYCVRAQGLIDVVEDVDLIRVVQVRNVEHALDLGDPRLG